MRRLLILSGIVVLSAGALALLPASPASAPATSGTPKKKPKPFSALYRILDAKGSSTTTETGSYPGQTAQYRSEAAVFWSMRRTSVFVEVGLGPRFQLVIPHLLVTVKSKVSGSWLDCYAKEPCVPQSCRSSDSHRDTWPFVLRKVRSVVQARSFTAFYSNACGARITFLNSFPDKFPEALYRSKVYPLSHFKVDVGDSFLVFFEGSIGFKAEPPAEGQKTFEWDGVIRLKRVK